MAVTLPRAILDLDEFNESKNIMVHADTGVGKTILAGQLPGKVLIFSSESGTIVIKRMLSKLGMSESAMKRFKIWPIRRFMDLEEAYIWNRDNPGAFDWGVFDTATSIQQRAMRAAMERAVKHNPEKRDIDLPDRGEHQKMQNAMKRMISDFNELPINTLWLAQSMQREDKNGEEIVLPFIMGKDYEVSAWACAQMDALGCYRKRPVKTKADRSETIVERVLFWDSFVDSESVNYWAKDRFQVLPRRVVMARGEEQLWTMTDLLKMIDSDPRALKRAKVAVETRDDEEEVAAVSEEDAPAAKPARTVGKKRTVRVRRKEAANA